MWDDSLKIYEIIYIYIYIYIRNREVNVLEDKS